MTMFLTDRLGLNVTISEVHRIVTSYLDLPNTKG